MNTEKISAYLSNLSEEQRLLLKIPSELKGQEVMDYLFGQYALAMAFQRAAPYVANPETIFTSAEEFYHLLGSYEEVNFDYMEAQINNLSPEKSRALSILMETKGDDIALFLLIEELQNKSLSERGIAA